MRPPRSSASAAATAARVDRRRDARRPPRARAGPRRAAARRRATSAGGRGRGCAGCATRSGAVDQGPAAARRVFTAWPGSGAPGRAGGRASGEHRGLVQREDAAGRRRTHASLHHDVPHVRALGGVDEVRDGIVDGRHARAARAPTTTRSARLPASSEPMRSSMPSARAPPRVAISSTAAAGATVGSPVTCLRQERGRQHLLEHVEVVVAGGAVRAQAQPQPLPQHVARPGPRPTRSSCCSAGSARRRRPPPSGSRGRPASATRRARPPRPCAGRPGRAGARSASCRSAPAPAAARRRTRRGG